MCMHGNVCTCANTPLSIVHLSDCCVQGLIFIDRQSRTLLLGIGKFVPAEGDCSVQNRITNHP